MRTICLALSLSLAAAPAAFAAVTTTGGAGGTGGTKPPCPTVHAGAPHAQNLFHPFNTHQTLGGGSGSGGGGGLGCHNGQGQAQAQGHGQAHLQGQTVKPLHLHHFASLGRRG